MFFLYQRLHLPALSPAINVIADRARSNANSTYASDRPDEPGVSSFELEKRATSNQLMFMRHMYSQQCEARAVYVPEMSV